MTQAAFGKLIQVTPIMVSCWELGKTSVKPCYWNQLESIQPKKETKAMEKPLKAVQPGKPAGQSWTAEQIQKLRNDLKLTQAAFGKLCNVTGALVCNWEHGKTPVSERCRKTLDGLLPETKKPITSNGLPEVAAVDILKIRQKHALSRAALGKHLGVTAYEISKWEKTGDIPERIKRKLASM